MGTEADFAINMKEKERSALACGEEYRAKVFFSSQPRSEFDLHFSVLSKGEIFKSGTMKVFAGEENNEKALVGEAKKLAALNDDDLENESTKVVTMEEISIPINFKVSPSFKLVIFVDEGNQTLTDSHTYKIEACQQHEVSSSWSEKKVNPGSSVTLSVNAETASLCAISATDKSVELLGNKNKITRASIGKLQKDIGERKMRSRENHWEFQRKCPETFKALKVYGSTGIQIMTDLSIMNSCKTITDAINENEYEPEIYEDTVAFSAPMAQTSFAAESASFAGAPPRVENRIAVSKVSSDVVDK